MYRIIEAGELAKFGTTESAAATLKALMRCQINSWPQLAEGGQSLRDVKRRVLKLDGDEVRVELNPKRVKSTAANLTPEALAKRPCFLCPQNLPAGQAGVLVNLNYIALCNPIPIFPEHFTISHLEHRPQHSQMLRDMLRMAALLGSEFTVFYNGSKAGASAPDHLHFQACPRGSLPAMEKLEALPPAGLGMFPLAFAGNSYAALVAAEEERALDSVERLIKAHAAERPAGRELMNIACTHTARGWEIIVALRTQHRPAIYFAEGSSGMLISPAAVEMFGVAVTVRPEDFERLDVEMLRSIYREVTRPADSLLGPRGVL
jgi:hypothetical protein